MDKKTMNMVLLVGVAGLAVYLLTRPKTPGYTMPTVYSSNPAYNPALYSAGGAAPPGYTAPGNTTSSIIAASGQAAGSLLSSLGDIFA